MNWGCCETPHITWHFEDNNANLICDNCIQDWIPNKPMRFETDPTESSTNGGADISLEIVSAVISNVTYQMAWQTLLSRIDQKSSWGKNLLKDLMLDCLTNPNMVDAAEVEATTATVKDEDHRVTETVEESLAGVYPFAVNELGDVGGNSV